MTTNILDAFSLRVPRQSNCCCHLIYSKFRIVPLSPVVTTDTPTDSEDGRSLRVTQWGLEGLYSAASKMERSVK